MASATTTASTRAIPAALSTTKIRLLHHHVHNNLPRFPSHLPASASPCPRFRFGSRFTSFGAGFNSSSSSSFSNTRTMATSQIPAGKCEWLVVVPDKPGKLEQRLEVRAQHLVGIKPLVESGFVKKGGAILNEKPEGTDASKFNFYGSTLVCIASSKEEILEQLSKDIYARTGVWDLENVQIWAAKFAV